MEVSPHSGVCWRTLTPLSAVAHIQQIEAANRYLHEQNQRIVADNEKLRE